MRLPKRFLPHTVIVEPYLGDGAYGPQYGPEQTVRCFVDDTRKVVRDTDGAEVASETTVFTRPDADIPEGSQIQVGGRTTRVIRTARRDGGGLPTPDHLEVTCE